MSSAFRRESHVFTLDRGGRGGEGRREGRTLIVVESGDNCKSLNWCQFETWLQLKTLIHVFWDTKKTWKAQQMNQANLLQVHLQVGMYIRRRIDTLHDFRR